MSICGGSLPHRSICIRDEPPVAGQGARRLKNKSSADLDGVFGDYFLVGFHVALLVRDIPTERLEERIEKLPTQLGFIVTLAFVGFAVLLEPVDKGSNEKGRLTHNLQSLFVSV